MRTNFRLLAAMVWLLTMGACQNHDTDTLQGNKIAVKVNFSAFDLCISDDIATEHQTRATAKTAGVTRLSLNVLEDGNPDRVAFAKELELNAGETDFDAVTLMVSPGSYNFVAVAHNAGKANLPAEIVSTTEVTIPMTGVPPTYTCVKQVTLTDDTSTSLTMDFGNRVTSTFVLCITDPTPEEVATCEIVINPEAETADSFTINPQTGFWPENLRVASSYPKSSTFTEKNLKLYTYLTQEEETVDVQINMKAEDGSVLVSRTLRNVTLKKHSTTKASGNFFSGAIFVFADEQTDSDITIAL